MAPRAIKCPKLPAKTRTTKGKATARGSWKKGIGEAEHDQMLQAANGSPTAGSIIKTPQAGKHHQKDGIYVTKHQRVVPGQMSREIRLASRPGGIPTAANFTLAQDNKLEPLQDQQVLVRNLVYVCGSLRCAARHERGKVVRSAVRVGQSARWRRQSARSCESRAGEFKPGDAVTSSFGWREYFIASPKDLHPVSPRDSALSRFIWARLA